jgi:membrane-associated phospholipid phosphatase
MGLKSTLGESVQDGGGKMTGMPNTPKVSSLPTARTTNRFGARAALAAVALALVAIPGGLTLLMVEDRWAPLVRADNGARDSLHGLAMTHTVFVDFMQLISDPGSAVAWLIVLAFVVFWLLWRRLPRLALFVVITTAGSSLLNTVVKMVVQRPRPVFTHPVAHEPGLSFPSGHAQAAVVGYAVLLIVFLPILQGVWRRVAVTFAVLMVLAIGFSRIALGVHYLSDVVGGYILGAAWVAAIAAVFNTLRVDRGRWPVDVREVLGPAQEPRLSGTISDEEEPGKPR